MQVSEMGVLRAICCRCQKELLGITKSQSINFLISISRSNGRLLSRFPSSNQRSIHCSNRRSGQEWSRDSEEQQLPSVWTTYDPTLDRLVTKKITHDDVAEEEALDSDEENPVNLSSFDSVTEDSHAQGSVREAGDRRRGSGSVRVASNSNSSKNEGERIRENSNLRSGHGSVAREIELKRKKGKSRSVWVCSNCGKSYGQWWGTCQACGCAGTVIEFSDTVGSGIENRSWFLQKPGGLHPQRLREVNKGVNQSSWRIQLSGLFGAEISRVLGGGLVPGSLVLVGGDPGVGKSTLLLQIAAMVAEGHGFDGQAPVVYVSGEESIEQIGNRADRMRIGTEDLFLYSSTDIEDILEKIQPLSPRALIVDSIQTVYLKGVSGSAGGVPQVKECTSAMLRFAKDTNIPVFLVGHVTKTGDIAGPRVLEHIVDVVLYMEGEKYSTHRFLRSVKNRFGSTDELGVFEMSSSGLHAVTNPSGIFLSEQYLDSEILAGLAVAVIIDGSRTFLLEIQALCLRDTSVQRQFNGVNRSRADLIIAVLVKQAGLKLQDHAIFVNVVSGIKLDDTAGDLAMAAAICSSFLEFPIPNDIAFIGEIGLGGELRPVPRMDKRVNAVAKLGYKKCIVPKSTEKSLSSLQLDGLMILGCKNFKEVINCVF